jgi:hypothetical protein
MMIHMKVRQAHPLSVGQVAELGMRLPLEVSGLVCEAIHKVL